MMESMTSIRSLKIMAVFFLGVNGLLLLIYLGWFKEFPVLKDHFDLKILPSNDGKPPPFKNTPGLLKQPECHLPTTWDLKNTAKPMEILKLSENSTCLEYLIKRHCYKDNRIVPNVVHYVRFKNKLFPVYSYISFLGSWKHVKPCFIVIHGDLPSGPLFEKFLTHGPRVIFMKRTPKQKIFGTKLSYIQHKTDVARMEIILQYGGIYMDDDTVPVKSLDSFRNYSTCLGKETEEKLGNCIIISKPSSKFLQIWMETYHNYNPKEWAFQSTRVPFELYKVLKHLVYVEEWFLRPNFKQTDQLYKKCVDWSKSFTIHFYGKARVKKETLSRIRYLKSTFGEVARYIIYDKKDLHKIDEKKTKKKKT